MARRWACPWAGGDPPGPDRHRGGAGRLGRPHGRRAEGRAGRPTACSRRGGGDMALHDPAFTIGIEEEYLLVDRKTRDLVPDPPAGPVRGLPEGAGDPGDAGIPALADRGRHRRLPTLSTRRAPSWRGFARTVAEIAGAVRPGADRRLDPSLRRLEASRRHTDKERYNMLARDLQGAGAAAGDLRHACACRASRTRSCASI